MVNRSSTLVRAFAASRSRRSGATRRSAIALPKRLAKVASGSSGTTTPPASGPEPTTSRMPATSVTTSERPAAAASRTNSDMPSQREAMTTTSAAASHDGTSRLRPDQHDVVVGADGGGERLAVGSVADEVEPGAVDGVRGPSARPTAAGPGPSAGSAARR